MKKFSSYIFVILILFLAQSFGGSSKPPWEKENVSFPMMNQEIRHTLEENDRQGEVHEKQLANTGTEVANNKQWYKFKEVSRKIQDRLGIVSLAIQAIPAGIVITQKTASIKDNVQKIISELEDAPYVVVLALEDHINFLEDLQMTTQYMIGLIASYGTINQMEKAERKILLDFAVDEFKRLDKTSYLMYLKIRDIKRSIRFKTNSINFWVNRDKQIIEEILANIQTF